MQIVFNICLVLWNLAILVAIGVLLFSDMSWITKGLALIVTPMVCMTGLSSWKRMMRSFSSNTDQIE